MKNVISYLLAISALLVTSCSNPASVCGAGICHKDVEDGGCAIFRPYCPCLNTSEDTVDAICHTENPLTGYAFVDDAGRSAQT